MQGSPPPPPPKKHTHPPTCTAAALKQQGHGWGLCAAGWQHRGLGHTKCRAGSSDAQQRCRRGQRVQCADTRIASRVCQRRQAGKSQ